MQYLLDTNVCVMYLNGRSAAVRERLLATPTEEMAVCSVVKSELFYGAFRSNNPKQTLERQQAFLSRFVSLPFEDEAALLSGKIRAALASIGTPIGSYDLQIAAITLANDITLVTHNVQEFRRVDQLKIEDWEIK
ncbi:type II toxin-antitoxin system VapC family toxin [cf. Phormidesmis sp. LEGE 11477]|uniref:type II toxin-antitoxin system tRNA(fMet)-specific endonuclease VapC n=1 Tax=cf. Phormidesmis sp. LEGE 11477 TaxID=1828680 RepID=UPI0018829EA8|nr:type II toxin-antitoxin system VapC family toxin [cf. Phormidesmis sp. LEGE 11477]MBE9062844.1 type II toxin-antitoxin system VapC family toxin [cf. Phormidesmis sp. LEGE 11477]